MKTSRVSTSSLLVIGHALIIALLAVASPAHAQQLSATSTAVFEGQHQDPNRARTSVEIGTVPDAPRTLLDTHGVDELSLDEAREQYRERGLAAPIVLMSVSFTFAVPLIFFGAIINVISDNARPLVGGIACAAVGIGSGFWLGRELRMRRALSARIRDLEGAGLQSPPVSVSLTVRADHANFSLSTRF